MTLPGTGKRSESDTDRRILEFLQSDPGAVVSGELLSRQLGISRTAVWKRINNLRAKGSTILKVPAKGYRLLANSPLLSPATVMAGLKTERIACQVHCFDLLSSTNVEAARYAEENSPDGTVLLADAQTAGKGRLGRTWVSPPGVNLYCSIILRPPMPPYCAPQLTFLSAVAVVQTISSCSGLPATIKWPNDILINGRKVAGLLNELSAETERIKHVILGIGINLNMTSDQFPQGLRAPASSLLLEGAGQQDRLALLRQLLRNLDSLYSLYLSEGFEPIKQLWLLQSSTIGRQVEILNDGKPAFTGLATGLAENGALLVTLGTGQVETVFAGDVRILKGGF